MSRFLIISKSTKTWFFENLRKAAFKIVDRDGSGSIDFEELKHAFHSLGYQIPDDKLRIMLADVDTVRSLTFSNWKFQLAVKFFKPFLEQYFGNFSKCIHIEICIELWSQFLIRPRAKPFRRLQGLEQFVRNELIRHYVFIRFWISLTVRTLYKTPI